MKKRTSILIAALLVISLLAGCGKSSTATSKAKSDFPSKPITIICIYGAGGGTDLSTRALAASMAKVLGVPVSVVNKAGGSGSVGLTELLNSANDGYTLGTTTYSSICIAPNQLKLSYKPESFEYLGTIKQYEYGWLVKADSKWQNFQDFVADCKASKAGFNVMGSGFPHQIMVPEVAETTGAPFNFVPCDGSAEACTALLGGHVEAISLDLADAASYLKSGEMRVIVSTMDKRYWKAEDVPTLRECGYDRAYLSYQGIGLPAGCDPERLKILRDAFNKAIEDPDFITAMGNLNNKIFNLNYSDFDSLLKKDYQVYKEYFAKQGS